MAPRLVLASALIGLGVPSRVAGQGTGVPVRNAGVIQGISLGVDLGFGQTRRSSGQRDDKSRAISGSLSAGFGPIGGSVSLSRLKVTPGQGQSSMVTVGAATAELSIIGGPLIPLKIVWQAGYVRPLGTGASPPWRGSLGLGAALTIPAAVFSIRPWIAPRVDYFGRPAGGARVKPSLSAGIDLGLLNGLGVRVGYDNRLGWSDVAERAAGVSLGVRYQFR